MLSSKYKFTIILLWLASLIAIYLFGYYQGHIKTFNNFVKQFEASEIEVGYGRYIGYKNISANIEQNEIDKAKCRADLNASALYDELKICFSKNECKKLFDEEKEFEVSPELFEGKPKSFKYYPVINGIRSCKN